MKAIITGIQAETLTPFAYHSLMVHGGSSTLPELISDHAIMFGLAATLGMMRASVCLPPKDYKRDLDAMPWRASIFTTTTPRLLAPITRRLNLEEEGGFKSRHYAVTSKGNFKNYFSTQEVPAGIGYSGALFGFDPFKETQRDELIIRIGLHRGGMLRLTPAPVEQVQLNAATAHLFGRELSVARYLLYGIQLTPKMSSKEALAEVQQWN
ncbi:hypothetical protein [Thiofilum flexile]|uniref:hypothetical protein n=1 Tax=Thiofilum flexile TaxID=125627 RepID=UPI000367C4F9|nr:hypothetical protein [Thiofilum flexile]